jgi:hypothetical protein
MDFSIKKYIELIESLKEANYHFQTFDYFIRNPKERTVILRHDVDARPENSLMFAKIQSEFDISGSYYFRVVKQSWDERIIREIDQLGHEIGYHYESLTTSKGNLENAIIDFGSNLEKFRKIVPVQTICMHGSPMSKYDSKDIWKIHNYRDFGIIGEPYFDVNYQKVLYLTDTGRKWNGDKVSIRDKVESSFSYSFRKTDDIINAVKDGKLPEQIMFTFHPQRWTNNKALWYQELLMQNSKNLIKRVINVSR